MIGKYVVISTDKDKRGVFCGYLKETGFDDKMSERFVVLENCKMIVSWSKETKGFVGLAAIGAQRGSILSDAAPSAKLYGVVSILKCSAVAKKVLEEY